MNFKNISYAALMLKYRQ